MLMSPGRQAGFHWPTEKSLCFGMLHSNEEWWNEAFRRTQILAISETIIFLNIFASLTEIVGVCVLPSRITFLALRLSYHSLLILRREESSTLLKGMDKERDGVGLEIFGVANLVQILRKLLSSALEVVRCELGRGLVCGFRRHFCCFLLNNVEEYKRFLFGQKAADTK